MRSRIKNQETVRESTDGSGRMSTPRPHSPVPKVAQDEIIIRIHSTLARLVQQRVAESVHRLADSRSADEQRLMHKAARYAAHRGFDPDPEHAVTRFVDNGQPVARWAEHGTSPACIVQQGRDAKF